MIHLEGPGAGGASSGSCDPDLLLYDIEDCTHKQRYENHPAYGTWTADFMLQKNESRAFLSKYLNDPRVPWRHKRREMIVIARVILVAKWLAKIKQRSDVGCRLCKTAREQRGAKFAGRDVWAHQECLLRWKGDNRHSCPPLHLETSICMPACKLHKHQQVSSGLSHLIKRIV